MEKERTQKDLSPVDHNLLLDRGITKIIAGKTTELDPCIGDQGCQMRALPLAFIANKVLQKEPLNYGEEKFLVALEVVWANTSRIVTKNGIFIREKTGNSILPDKIKSNYKVKERDHIMYAYRKYAANYAIDFFTSQAQHHLTTHQSLLSQDLMASILKDIRFLNRECEKIKCLPYLTSGKVILNWIVANRQHLVVVVKRYQVTRDKYLLQRAKAILYGPVDGSCELYEPLKETQKIDTPCLCFEFYSFFDPSIENSPSLYHPNFDVYLEELMKLNIFKLIEANWAQHEQYADIKDAQNPPSYILEPNSLHKHYHSLLELSYKLRLPKLVQVKVADLYLKAEVMENGKKVIDKCYKLLEKRPWFLLNHIYCSNYASRTLYCESLNLHDEKILHHFVRVFDDTNTYENALEFKR